MNKQVFTLIVLMTVPLVGCGANPAATSLSGSYVQELARARRAGLPVEMAQLQAKLPPISQNAAPLYRLLTQRLRDKPLASEDRIVDGLAGSMMPSTQELAQARPALARRTDLLRLVHSAAARPQCVFVRDWDNPDPANIQFPELAAVRHAARLLTSESLVMAASGQDVAAVRNESLGFRIARHADSDHTLISYLVGLAVDAITLSGFRKIIYLSHGDPRVAYAVQEAVQRGWQPQSLAASLRTEVAFQQGEIAMLRRTGPSALDEMTGGPSGPAAAKSNNFPHVNPILWQRFLDLNGAYLLGVMPQAIAAIDRPYPQAEDSLKSITAEVIQPKDLTHLIAVIMLPNTELMVQKRAEVRALTGVTRAGAALLVYRASHGAFPATLGQALSPVPLDPYNDQPLCYRRDGLGFVVYSVGPDGSFDGGTTSVRPDPKQALFHYPLPAYAAPRG